MVRKVLYPAVFVLVALMAGSAFAGWQFVLVQTANPEYGYEYDGRIYMPDGMGLVPEGSLVQFILDTEGDGLDDPMSFFDVDMSGAIEFGPELDAVTMWVNAGANPSAISDDQLLVAAGWDGTSVIGAGADAGPGEILVYPDNPYVVTNGATGQIFGWRVWNLTAEGLATFCTRPGEELWYTSGTEKGAWFWYPGGDPYDPWKIGWPEGAQPGDWMFGGEVGAEVGMFLMTGNPYYRERNILDKKLGTCGIIPEPGTMLLIGSSVLLLVLRRKK
jgi:hypothetical protein